MTLTSEPTQKENPAAPVARALEDRAPAGLRMPELEQVLAAVDASLSIQSRAQFFVWSIGALYSVFPHETLVCIQAEENRRTVECFSANPLRRDFAFEVDRERGSLPEAILDAWVGNQRRCIEFKALPTSIGTRETAIAVRLHQLGRRNAIAHGDLKPEGMSGSLLVFFDVLEPQWGREIVELLQLIAPHVGAAWRRAVRGPQSETRVEPEPAADILTGREIEVLTWVREGKTNSEIGQIMNISGLTVKNHVQKILRKLAAQNRTHAVARGLNLNLLG